MHRSPLSRRRRDNPRRCCERCRGYIDVMFFVVPLRVGWEVSGGVYMTSVMSLVTNAWLFKTITSTNALHFCRWNQKTSQLRAAKRCHPFKSFRFEPSLSSPGPGFTYTYRQLQANLLGCQLCISLAPSLCHNSLRWNDVTESFSFIIFIFLIFPVICWARSPFIAVMTKFSFVLCENEAESQVALLSFTFAP